MEILPPTIRDRQTLELLGRCLAVDATPERNAALRLDTFSPDFSWNRLITLAAEQNVLVPLIYSLKDRGLLLPAPRRDGTEASDRHPTRRLEAFYEQHLGRQANLRSQLFEITTAFNERDIVPLLLKGARYLLPDAPAWAEARPMRDLDILIDPADAEGAQQVLVALGYGSLPSLSLTDHHLAPMMRDGCHGTIELHTKALVQDARGILSTESVWSLSHERSFGAATLRTMPPGWQMLMGVLHHQLGDRGYRRRVLALKGLWEFAREAHELSESDWRTVANHVASRGGRDVIGEWLALAARLFGLTPPEAVAVSDRDRQRATATLRWAGRPAGMRRSLFFADILLFAFSRERLATRYGRAPRGLMLGIRLRHLLFLLNRHGRLQFRRVFASPERRR